MTLVVRSPPPPPSLQLLHASPSVHVAEGFASADELDHVLRAAGDERRLASLGVEPVHDATGLHFELPIAGDAVLETLALRMMAAVGLTNALGDTFRFRRYSPGEWHPPHVDAYAFEDLVLLATGMLCLTEPQEGGDTVFLRAPAGPLSVPARRGRFVLWYNYLTDGTVDAASYHEGARVLRGEKTTITYFFYTPRAAAAARLEARG